MSASSPHATRSDAADRDLLINALLVLSNDQVLYENLPDEVRQVCKQAADALMTPSAEQRTERDPCTAGLYRLAAECGWSVVSSRPPALYIRDKLTNAAPHVADHSPISKTGAGDSGLTGADVRAAAPSESEQCHYCGVSYQKPVSYHHSEEECAENQCAAPSDTPRTDKELIYTGERGVYIVVAATFARQLERELAEAREGWDRCLKLATTEHFKRHEAERSNHSASKRVKPDPGDYGKPCVHFPSCGCGGEGIVDSACWPQADRSSTRGNK